MRAKANNQAARKERERTPCPQAGKIIESASNVCDQCGDELRTARLVAVVEVAHAPDKRQLH
jgi:RNA polymerase-binding transcription factor DksA